MSYKKKAKSRAYLCTIIWNEEHDMRSLENLKKGVSLKRKVLKSRNAKQVPIVTVKYRKPLLPYDASRGNSKYGWGGTVCKRQLPREADIYIHYQYV
jgi:hypothetical protein